ncbi:MAG TPA: Ppx/GppA phosphatase family protein [Gemmatimonadales bacterium]|nr:Ppx/GppA phosphatase family protein [Gemmatimonadales bacterium]
MTEPIERIAAIDVGSNTVLLLIAEHHPTAGLTIIAEAEDQPRLGAGLSATGRLSQAAMARALETIARMRELCHAHRVSRIGAVATAAVREAENGEDFVLLVRDLGIPLQAISPETEAALSYRSAAHHFPGAERTLVADIGGGSLELIGAVGGRIRLSRSLPLGAVRLTELALPLSTLRDQIGRALDQMVPRREWVGSAVIGSGGTFASLAAMALAERGASGQPVHGVEMPATEVEDLLERLSGLSPEARRQVPGLRPERADIIVAGVAVAAELLDRVKASSVRVNGYGLREGLLLEMAGIG